MNRVGKIMNTSKKLGKIIRIVLFSVSLLLILSVLLGTYFYVDSLNHEKNLTKNFIATVFNTETGEYDFEKAKVKNQDVAAFIKVEGTELHNPVFKADDNAFYATHNAEKDKSDYGALYFDVNSVLSGKSQSKNLVIYGQNMTDGTMLGILESFEDIDFLKQNPTIVLNTEQGEKVYTVFAVYRTNADQNDNNGYCFNYRPSTFSTDGAFTDWLNNVNSRNIYKTGLKVSKNDSTLTLVTVTDTYSSERLVVCAKTTTDPEKEKETLEVKAVYNDNAIYPVAWYNAKNIEVPKAALKQIENEQAEIEKIKKLLAKKK